MTRPQPAGDGPERLELTATVQASIQVVAEDHPDDLVRCLRGLAAHPPPVAWELVLVVNAPDFEVAGLVAASSFPSSR